MTLRDELVRRSDSRCELCHASGDLSVLAVGPESPEGADGSVLSCPTCAEQIDGSAQMDSDHWTVLPETMWSVVPAVQVLAWRMLRRLRSEAWAADALELLYLEDETLAWATSGDDSDDLLAASGSTGHRDANGVSLSAGDAVTLIKDLNVKGAGFTAKRGTAVRGISLVQDNTAHIEGRINGQRIVILTEFVKKSS
jgi:protein PhnA